VEEDVMSDRYVLEMGRCRDDRGDLTGQVRATLLRLGDDTRIANICEADTGELAAWVVLQGHERDIVGYSRPNGPPQWETGALSVAECAMAVMDGGEECDL
jgi:hypothetical protein